MEQETTPCSAQPPLVHIHAFEPASRVNGPGKRAVVWFQGCTLGCAGCFNPATHPVERGTRIGVDTLAGRILDAAPRVEGVTLSGGEPFQQPAGLLALLRALSSSGLTTLCFSGYTLSEIQRLAEGPAILSRLDVLVAGRYVESRPASRPLLGSSNQRVHFLTGRYGPADLQSVRPREFVLHADGSVIATGLAPLDPFGTADRGPR